MFSLNRYMLSLMKDERTGPLAAAVKVVLRLASGLYSFGIWLVDLGYSSGIRKIHKAPLPVVSIGNITLGGTGKTPFTIFVASYFASAGKKTAVLSRGYGSDENRMLAEELPDVRVYAAQDRVKSARLAAADGCDVIVLDDGFQHRRLHRDLDIVLVDRSTLFGNGSLVPRGVLREKPSSLSRADLIVVSKSDGFSALQKTEAAACLAEVAPGKPVVTAAHKASFLTDVTGAIFPVSALRGKNVVLASGIADPDHFARMVEECGALIVGRIDQPDHHAYTRSDAARIEKECLAKNADMVVITKKDHVKMRGLDIRSFEEKIFVFNIDVDVVEGKERLVAGLNSVLSGNRD